MCLVHDPEDKNMMRGVHRTGMFSEVEQDSKLTREPSRLELPLSSRLEVTRLEQVNLT